MKEITDTRSLLVTLDDRPVEASARKAFDDEIWARRGEEGAILVTDLSGFSLQTKKNGILQVLHVFRRCETTCMPLIHARGGTLMKQEADDLIAIFSDPLAALDAAIEMQRATQALNATLADPDDHVRMCIGVESGPLLRLEDDAFGDTVNVAFKLGEDLAEPLEILVGPTLYAHARDAGFDFGGCAVEGPRSMEVSRILLDVWSVRPVAEGLR